MFPFFSPRRGWCRAQRQTTSCFLNIETLEDRRIPSASRPAVINYPVGGGNPDHENMFVTQNGNLELYFWDGSGWNFVNLGNPGVPLNGVPAVANSVDHVHENVYVTDYNGNLDLDIWDGSGWNWANLGNPGVPVYTTPAAFGSQLVFVTDFNGNLDLAFWDGSRWNWESLGNPGVPLYGDPAAIVYNPVGSTRWNVFVADQNGNLDLAFNRLDGFGWNWESLGNPGAWVYGDPAVINYPVGNVLHENVFVTDGNGNLDNAYWNGSRWNWGILGNPGMPLFESAPAVINYPVGNVLHENVFVTDDNGNLDNAYWDGSGWNWGILGNPGVPLYGDPAVINYQVGNVLHENVFVVDHPGGNLDNAYWDGSQWNWGTVGGVGPQGHAPAVGSNPRPPAKSDPGIPLDPLWSIGSGTTASAAKDMPLSAFHHHQAEDALFTLLTDDTSLLAPLG